MEFEQAFPLRFWINLGRREDRRNETEARLAEAEVTAERFAAVDGKSKKPEARDKRPQLGALHAARMIGGLRQDAAATVDGAATVRGYESAGRYALALTQRLAIREARRRRVPALLLMEDDVVFHPNFQALIGTVELPEDWEM